MHAETHLQKQTKKKHSTTRTDRETPEPKNERRRRRKGKKKASAGRGHGVDAEVRVRVEVGERVLDEETQGETQTPQRGLGFPQRLREREDKRKHGGEETNQTQKGGTQTKTKHGSGLEGLKNQTRAQPQRQKTRNKQQMTKPRPQQKKKQKSYQRLQGSVHCGVEGPMGCPAFF